MPPPRALHGMASDGGFAAASLVDVAVRAAVQAGAPRRTVAATAAAVASVVMMELRGSAGASGRASAPPPSASKRRRIKRKKKAEKEKLAASSRPAPSADEASSGGGPGGAPAGELASAAPVLSSTAAEHPPVLKPIDEKPARLTCQHCGETFASRNKLFDHLESSGHSKFFAPRSAGDSASISGLSAGSPEPSAASGQLTRAAADADSIELGQERVGSTGSATASVDARSNAVAFPKPQGATPRPRKGHGARPY